MPLLEACSIAHSFEHCLFADVSFGAGEGEAVAIIGVSGSGKSTLLHNLSTLLRPLSGEVKLFGSPLYTLPSSTLLKLRRHDVGIIFQAHYLFRGFSANENLEVASLLTGLPVDNEMLEQFGIAQILHQNVGQLSGGQQQRLSIARVLTKKPRIIFADEPTGNLDQGTATQVMEILFDYVRKNRALLVFATHDLALAKACDRVYLLKDKKLSLWNS